MSGSKPRILYIVHGYDNRAGTEEHTKALAGGLEDRFETAIAFPDGDQLKLVEKGRETLSLEADSPVWPFTPYSLEKTELAFSQIVEHFKPDLIHIQHFIYWPLGIIDRATDLGLPVVLSYHDYYVLTPHFTMQFTEPEETLSAKYSELIFQQDASDYLKKRREVITHSLNQVPHHIVPSQFLADELSRVFPRNYQVIHHGIEPFSPQPTAPATNGLRFGYIGSLLPQKGWANLTRAFCEVRKELPCELIFFGGGQRPQETNIPGVYFNPPYDQSNIAEVLTKFDVGVIPSEFKETFNLVLSEMWNASKPVAAARIGALEERIQDKRNGILFESGNVEDISRALRWFLEHEDQWKAWQLPAPRMIDEMLQDYSELYGNILKAQAS